MTRPKACLVDVWDTLVKCDPTVSDAEVARRSGIDPLVLHAELKRLRPALHRGRLSMTQAMAQVLPGTRLPPQEAARIYAGSHPDHSWLVEDADEFLTALKQQGYLIGLVSNCTESTRKVLSALHLLDRVDAVVLSCEVGYVKPDPEIYLHAIDELGVAPAEAVFIDDRPGHCAGATAVGIQAIQILRNGASPGATRAVRTLLDIPALL
jgi:HAD superfamily hydrolase (TIGR01509 family)